MWVCLEVCLTISVYTLHIVLTFPEYGAIVAQFLAKLRNHDYELSDWQKIEHRQFTNMPPP